jgi:hypothetical protein
MEITSDDFLNGERVGLYRLLLYTRQAPESKLSCEESKKAKGKSEEADTDG